MDRHPTKGDPVCRAHDDDALRRIVALRPGGESGRGDRARVHNAGVRSDHELGRDAPVGPRTLAHIANQRTQARCVAGIKEIRYLRRMDMIQSASAWHVVHRRRASLSDES